ncbi:uncharacterized protein LOC143509916 [Brachyhypopomus gauderio]|uniref:uncharacterized protein LOC143509916 n=1 Tax=Brachyhypopomus gauderio TaxID=698409 RepID=UPI0040429612
MYNMRTVLFLAVMATFSECKPVMWYNMHTDESDSSSESQSSEETTLPGILESVLLTTQPGNLESVLLTTQPGNLESVLLTTQPGNLESVLLTTQPGNLESVLLTTVQPSIQDDLHIKGGDSNFSGADATPPLSSGPGIVVNTAPTLIPPPAEGPNPSQAETTELLFTSAPTNVSIPHESRGDM